MSVPIKNGTLTSKANATKRNVITSVIDDAVMLTIYHSIDICLQFQLYLLLFKHLVIDFGFWAVDPNGTMTSSTTTRKYPFVCFFCFSIPFCQGPLCAPSFLLGHSNYLLGPQSSLLEPPNSVKGSPSSF